MDAAKIARINALARKSKDCGLSDEEKAEQKLLRDEYIQCVKRSLVGQLENTYVVDESGNVSRLRNKESMQPEAGQGQSEACPK